MHHVVFAISLWSAVLIFEGIVGLLGILLVPLGLIFQRERATPLTGPCSEWRYLRMPWPFWVWDNSLFGTRGDSAGIYWSLQSPNWISRLPVSCQDFMKSWYYLALHEPLYNLRRWVLSCDTGGHRIRLILGKSELNLKDQLFGQQLCRCGLIKYGYHLLCKLPKTNKALSINIGYNIYPGPCRGEIVGLSFNYSIHSIEDK